MPDTIGSAWVEINSNITQLQREIAGLKGHVDASARNMETRFNSATKAIAGLGSVIATIGIAKLGTDIIGAATKMDTLHRMLVNVEGSQKAANARFEQFRILAKEPVLDPFNLSKFYVQLRSVNVEGGLSIKFMKSLANAMAGVGAGNEQFAMAMTQFAQMAGQGKLIGQDLRVITESFPQIRKYLREAFEGIADPEILAKQGHTAIEIFTKLNEVMEKAPKFLGGALAAQENFTQSLQLFYAALAKDILPAVSDFLIKITNLMDKFSELDEGTKKVIGKAVVGGVGLLGIASAIGSITGALNLLSASAGLKALTSGALAGGLANVGGMAVSAGAGAGTGAVKTISTLSIASATIGKLLLPIGAFAAIWELTKWSQKGFENVPAPGTSPGGTSTMALPRFGVTPKKPSSTMSDEDYAEYLRAVSSKYGPVGGTKPVSELAISYADMIKEIGEASVHFLMDPFGYSTEAGKYKSKLIPHAGAEELGMLKARQTAEMDIRTPELFPIGQVTGPQVGTTGIVGPSMRGGTVIDKDFLRETNTEWGKTFETQKKIVGIESDIDKANQKIIDGWSEGAQGMNDVRDTWDELADDLMTGTEKIRKEQSQFWLDMSSFATSALDSTISKSIDDFYNHFGWVMSDTENSWKAFCNNLLAEFIKMLIKMEIEAEAKSFWKFVQNITSGGGTGGTEGGGGGGKKDWLETLSEGMGIVGMGAKVLKWAKGLGHGGEEIPGGGTGGGTGGGIGGIAGGTLAGILGVIGAGTAEQQAAKAVGSEYGGQAHKYTSSFWGKIGNYIPAGMLINWGLRSGSKEWRESQGLEHYARGGIVTKPTIAMIGESGPEAIVPLSKGNITNRSDNFVVNISFPNATLDSVDQNQIDRFISKAIPSLRRAVSNGVLS